MESKFSCRNNASRHSGLSLGIAAVVFTAGFGATPAFAKSNKQAEETVKPCPVDTTIRTADPNLLKRFRSLAGCTEQVLVAPASELDYVEPDGRVIIADRSDGGRDYADERGDDGYNLQYADIREANDDDRNDDGVNGDGMGDAGGEAQKPKRKSKAKFAAKVESEKKKGTEVQVYRYDDASRSLAGTGTVVRIIPEETPPPAAGPAYAPGFGAQTAAAPASGSGILAMRPRSYRTQFDGIIANTANNHRIDPLLLHAVIQQESGYRQTARSHVGAQGLMQIMPGTGRMLGVHPAHLNDPAINVDAGARLLRRLYFRYDGNFDLVLAAYNAGEGAVQKYGNRVPPYRETQDYVKKVMQRYHKLVAEQNGVASNP